MHSSKITLDLIRVASPCTASWDAMRGDGASRFCVQCSKYVYNLSGMTREQAEALVLEREGNLCVRFFRRADGTMLTQDCPVGWRAAKKRIAWVGGAMASVLIAALGMTTLGAISSSGDRSDRVSPFTRIRDYFFPPPVCVMGDPFVPPAPPTQQPAADRP